MSQKNTPLWRIYIFENEFLLCENLFMADYKGKILAILKNNPDEYFTSSILASELGVSKKTIINTIKDINNNHFSIQSSKKGYKYFAESQQKTLDQQQTELIEYPDERKDYIIWSLLANKSVNIFDLSDDLFVSSSTIKSDINNLRKELLYKFNLSILYKKDSISLSGKEKDIRKLFDWRIRKESQNKFTTLTFLQNRFPSLDITQLKVIIQAELQKQGVFINDFQLIAIILHLCITIQRAESNNYITESTVTVPTLDIQPEFVAADKILQKVEKIYPSCKFNNFEKYNFSLLITSNSTRSSAETLLYDHIDPKIIELTNLIYSKVIETFSIDLSSLSFKNRFMLHLSSLLFRCSNGTSSKNELVLLTKTKFPLVYEIATFIAYQLKKETGYSINDEEISFIAFHIGNEIDEQIQKKSLVKCALITYNYNQIDYHLANKISSIFSSKIIITITETEEKDFYSFKDVDLVISNYNINTNHDYIIVHPLLSQDDIKTLENKIDKIINSKRNIHMKSSISTLFRKDLFLKNANINNESDSIIKMCNTLTTLGYVDEDFVDRVFEREKISSTAFGNYAIPHSLIIDANKTAIFVIINEKAIKWNDSNVNFIFLLCVSEKDKQIFRELFSSIIYLLTNNKIKQELLSAKDFEEFLTIINKHI